MRKPRARWHRTSGRMICISDFTGNWIRFRGSYFNAKEARAFAAWLLKAADWLEEREGE